MTTTYDNWQVWQDPRIAARFTSQRRGAIVGAETQFETMLRLIGYVPRSPLRVLDIGCGDGIVLATVADAYPLERGVALDGSPTMLAHARERFAGETAYGDRVECVEADFNDPAWVEALPIRDFDAVVSAFAIHHSEDDRKRALYAEIFGLLRPGGVFVNIEHVASLGRHGEEMFERAYAENLTRFRRSQGQQTTVEEVLHELRTRPDKAANRLTTVQTQLDWLCEIGYVDVDCYWKHYELAVLAGCGSEGVNG